jgi:PmbA protein
MPAEATDLLDVARAEEIFAIAEKAARSRGIRDVELIIAAGAEALTRFANNAIHQNVAEQTRHVSVRILHEQRTARASTNRFDSESIERAVHQAIATAQLIQPDAELPPLFEPVSIVPAERYFAATAACTPEHRARTVAEAIRLVESHRQTAAGIYSTESGAEAILNSRGVRAFHTETLARFSITALAADSSGWAKASAPDLTAFDPVALARSAAAKATLSANPRELEPGRYTVVLEPPAVLDIVGQMFGDFSATAVHDQRSFLTGRLGEKLFGENIEIADDVFHPLQAGAPFDGEGVPRTRLKLVDCGAPSEIAYSRMAALRENKPATGHGFPVPNEIGESPANIVIRGGDTTLDQMIATTERGILVTRLWYIREVDPYEKIMTGMTRDGTFSIIDGKLAGGIRNFRFNQSLIEMLNNVESMSREQRSSGEEAFDMVVPAMKVRDFQFTEVTRF